MLEVNIKNVQDYVVSSLIRDNNKIKILHWIKNI